MLSSRRLDPRSGSVFFLRGEIAQGFTRPGRGALRRHLPVSLLYATSTTKPSALARPSSTGTISTSATRGGPKTSGWSLPSGCQVASWTGSFPSIASEKWKSSRRNFIPAHGKQREEAAVSLGPAAGCSASCGGGGKAAARDPYRTGEAHPAPPAKPAVTVSSATVKPTISSPLAEPTAVTKIQHSHVISATKPKVTNNHADPSWTPPAGD